MASLTEVSAIARRAIKWGAIGLVIIMLVPVVWRLGRNIYRRLNPPAPPAPTVKYGKLPNINFPPDTGAKPVQYILETIAGGLPNLAQIGRVYVVGINKSRLATLDRFKGRIRPLGFTTKEIDVNDFTSKFIHPTLAADLVVDIIANGFSYRLDWTRESQIYDSHSIPIGNSAVNEARNFLSNLGLLPGDLASGMGKFSYLTATGSAMIPTEAVVNANFVRVDLFRASKDELQVVTPAADTSPVYVIISGLGGDKRVVEAGYHYSGTLDNDFGTYPLRGVDKAWQQLQAGQGHIAKRAGERAIVRRVSVAYYESDRPQGFLQPVYVFEGDGGFTAYVPAVAEEYIQSINP